MASSPPHETASRRMIFDQIGNAHFYRALHPRLSAALDYLSSVDASVPDGVHHLDGNDLIARVQSYDTVDEAAQRWESHRSYIDVQAVLTGEEQILCAPIDHLEGGTSYDSANDLINYTRSSADPIRLTLRPGDFAIFFPHDGHMPGVRVRTPVAVKKIVLKIAVW
jgi:YhcH/YjgK/YiaL family protein